MNYTNFINTLSYDKLLNIAYNIRDWSYENNLLYLLFGIVIIQELIYKNKLNKVLEQLTTKISKEIYIDLYSDDEDYEEEEEEKDDDDDDYDYEEDEDYEYEEDEDEDDDEYEEYNEEDDIKLICDNNIKNLKKRIKKLEKKFSKLKNLVDNIIIDKEENFIDISQN